MARGLQKMQSQAKNAGADTKTAEQRAADRKSAAANMAAYVCTYCKQTFANTAKEPMLREHFSLKHDKEPADDVTKAFPTFAFGVCGVIKKKDAAKAAAEATASAASSGGGAGGVSKKEKNKDAAAKAAAALAAAAGGAKAPAKKTKAAATAVADAEKADAAEAKAAESDEPIATGEETECSMDVEEPAAAPAPEIEIPEQVVSEEEAAARVAAKEAALAVEANYEAKAEEFTSGQMVLGVRALIEGQKETGLSLAEFDTLLLAADVKYAIQS